MPLFMCSACGCFDNTATSGYWAQQLAYYEKHGVGAPREGFRPQCSEHNPAIGAWHAEFPKESAAGMKVDGRGYLWRVCELPGVQHLGPFTDVVLPDGVKA